MKDPQISPPKLAILGANGQVGFEVTSWLHRNPGIGAIGVGRTRLSTAILRRLGVECRHVSAHDSSSFATVLGDCRTVVDFAWTRGSPVSVLLQMPRRARALVRSFNPNQRYIFISTQSVYRIDPSGPRFKVYGISKRLCERAARREAKARNVDLYIFRLGEVHGPFQNVTRSLADSFSSTVAVVPDLEAHIIFTRSIAEAILAADESKIQPGTYTLVENPGWSWREMHQYLSNWTGIRGNCVEEKIVAPARSVISLWLEELKVGTRRTIFREKEFIESLGEFVASERIRRARLQHYAGAARSEIKEEAAATTWRPYGQKINIPGKRVPLVSDTKKTILEANRDLEHYILSRLLPGAGESCEPGYFTKGD